MNATLERVLTPPPVDAPPPDADLVPFPFEGATGRGVRVAILDSGIDDGEPELEGRVAHQVSLLPLGSSGPDPVRDPLGHGTACARILVSVAPEVEILSVQVLDRWGRGEREAVLAGLMWAFGTGVDVVNLSLGTTRPAALSAMENLFVAAWRRRVVVVAAVANRNDPGSGAPGGDRRPGWWRFWKGEECGSSRPTTGSRRGRRGSNDERRGGSGIRRDADHDYLAVQRDFELWSGHVAVGGYVVFDDVSSLRGPSRVASELPHGYLQVGTSHNIWIVEKVAIE